MARQAHFDVPEVMQEVAQEFEEWRSSHSGRRPIPEALWKRAADLARQYGVFRTSKVLRLDYSKTEMGSVLSNADRPSSSSSRTGVKSA